MHFIGNIDVLVVTFCGSPADEIIRNDATNVAAEMVWK